MFCSQFEPKILCWNLLGDKLLATYLRESVADYRDSYSFPKESKKKKNRHSFACWNLMVPYEYFLYKIYQRTSCYTNVFIPCVLSFCQKYLKFDPREPHGSKSFMPANAQLELRQWSTFSGPVQENGNMREQIKASVLLVKGIDES